MKKTLLVIFALSFSTILQADTYTDWKPNSCNLNPTTGELILGFPYSYQQNNKTKFSTVPHCAQDVAQLIEIPASMDLNHALSLCLTALQSNLRLRVENLTCDNGVLKTNATTTLKVRK